MQVTDVYMHHQQDVMLIMRSAWVLHLTSQIFLATHHSLANNNCERITPSYTNCM